MDKNKAIRVSGLKREGNRLVIFGDVCESLVREYLASEPPRMPHDPLFTGHMG